MADERIVNEQERNIERYNERTSNEMRRQERLVDRQVRRIREIEGCVEENGLEDESKLVSLRERDELLLLLQQVQVELESCHHRLLASCETIEVLRNRLEKRDLMIRAMKTSRSWRITAPLRVLRRITDRLSANVRVLFKGRSGDYGR